MDEKTKQDVIETYSAYGDTVKTVQYLAMFFGMSIKV